MNRQSRQNTFDSMPRVGIYLIFALLITGPSTLVLAQSLTELESRDGLLVIVGEPSEPVLSKIQESWKGLIQVLVAPSSDGREFDVRQPDGKHALPDGGRTTQREYNGASLPYVDNCVNCLIQAGPSKLPTAELMRVLTPGGTLMTPEGESVVKPWPEEIDDWTHNLYDSTNNAVADDTTVGPPRHLQWIGSPDHGRHHNFLASVSSMVSSGGRLFTIIDQGSLVSAFLPPDWTLTARDAFNGITLWERKIPDWGPRLRNFRAGPAEIGRRVVALDEQVFVTLGFDAPVSVLDAATGEAKAVLPETSGAEEVLVGDGIVLIVAGDPKAELRDWAALDRDFTTAPSYQRRLVAVDAATQHLLWKRQDTETATILPMTVAMKAGRGFFVNEHGVNAVELRTGETLWQTAEPVAMLRQGKFAPTVVVHDDVLLYADRLPNPSDAERFYSERPKAYQERYRQLKAFPSRLRAYDVKSGERLWECEAGESFHTPTDILVIDDTVWYTATPAMLEGNFKQGRDLHTGEVVKRINGPDINHGRCYRNKATTKFLLGGKNGLDFIDPDSPDTRFIPHGMRGTCQLGILPCNGLIYLPPHACVCEAERKLNGFFALAPEHDSDAPSQDTPSSAPRLVRGPAYGFKPRLDAQAKAGEWPTFRHDLTRSGCSSTTLPDRLDSMWEQPIGRRPTAPVCAGGTLYVAAREDHILWALDAVRGKPRWSYQTSARIDSPPAIDAGMVVFGCRDGWLRCLRASDGELIWRFRGAPEERQVVVREQLESVWPLHGSPLIVNGRVYFAAGRASVLDGGITLFCLDLETGRKLARAHFQDNAGTEAKAKLAQDALLDVLSFVQGRVTMRSLCLTPDLEQSTPVEHLQSATGFLDDNFFHRSYWAYAKRVARYNTGNEAASGQMVAIDGEMAYAYGRDREYYLGHVKGFERHLCATSLAPRQLKIDPGPTEPSRFNRFSRVIGKYAPRGVDMAWSTPCPVLVKGMTVAGEKLVVAGPNFELHPSSYLVDPATDEIRIGSELENATKADEEINRAQRGLDEQDPPRLCVVSKRTGEIESTVDLPASPVFDGVIAASGRLYICREDGVVCCLGAE